MRQNILIETGIAWTKLGRERLVFLSDRMQVPDDFPSDIKSEIQINYFDMNDLDETVENVCKELIKSNNIRSNRDLLFSPEYIYDGKVLNDIEPFIRAGKTETQLENIVDKWIYNIGRFDYLQEKLMYVLERVAFFPVMGNDENILAFLKKIEGMISPSAADLRHTQNGILKQELSDAMILTKQIISYTELKTRNDTLECLKDPLKNRRKTENTERKFRIIHDEIKKIISNFEDEKSSFIWLIKVIAYDYAALSKIKMYEIDIERESEENIQDLNEAIEYFIKAIELAKMYDHNSEKLWLGYLQYNIARAYYKKYCIENDRSLLNDVKDNLLDAIEYRERWSKSDYYKGIFATALSYEYFLASVFDYKLRKNCEGYSNESKEEILCNALDLREELNRYCIESEVGVLYRMRDIIDDFIKENEE